MIESIHVIVLNAYGVIMPSLHRAASFLKDYSVLRAVFRYLAMAYDKKI